MSSSVYGHTLTKRKNPWGHFRKWIALFLRAFHFFEIPCVVGFFLLFSLWYPAGTHWVSCEKVNYFLKNQWKFVDFYALCDTCILGHPEIMCQQPPVLGARYVMNTPPSGITLHVMPTSGGIMCFKMGITIFRNACPLLFTLFVWYPKGISWKKKVGKQISWSLNPKPRTGAFTEI
jgi:hypothetical protein